MALHKKYDYLESLRPDIAIVPECASPAVLQKRLPRANGDAIVWAGAYPNKGLAVIGFGDVRFSRGGDLTDDVRQYPWFLPIEVIAPVRLNLLAVWAFDARARRVTPNAGSTTDAITYYGSFLQATDAQGNGVPAIVAGDFNASVVWDTNPRYAKFVDTDAALGKHGLKSVYHTRTGEEFGKESRETLRFTRNAGKRYHIDYVYASPTDLAGGEDCVLPPAADWSALSDHSPICVTLTLPLTPQPAA